MNDRDARLDGVPGDIGDEFGRSFFNSLHRPSEETVRKLLGRMGRRKRGGGQATPLLPGPEARAARRAEAHGGAPARPAAPPASAQEGPMHGPDTPPVERASQVWGLPRWLALVVDDRFVLDEDLDGEQFRLAASVGEAPSATGTGRCPAAHPQAPAKYVLGVHCMGTRGREIRLYDVGAGGSFDADACGGDPARGEALARAHLASLTDEDYARIAQAGGGPGRQIPIAGRSPFPLEAAIFTLDCDA